MDENQVIKEGTKLLINHTRHGWFEVLAARDFTASDNWYPVDLGENEVVQGSSRSWGPGDPIPCRKSLVTHIEVLEEVAA